MKLLVFSVYDTKVGAYAQPFILRSTGEALRGWIDVVNSKDTQFNKHPEDFTLFHIADYDEESGMFTNLKTPQSLGLALEYIKSNPQPSPENILQSLNKNKKQPEERVQ